MVDPDRASGGEPPSFVSGDDPAAKQPSSTEAAGALGHTDVIDLGDMSARRAAAEMLLPGVGAPDGSPRHGDLQLQDRPLTWAPR